MDRVMDYLKDRYDEEQSRFVHFEGKCSRLMTYLTVIMGVLVLVAKGAIGSKFSPSGLLDWSIVVTFCAVFFLLACSWGHSLAGIKVTESANLPRGRDTFEYMRDSDQKLVESYMYDCYMDTIESLVEKVDNKSRCIELAYEELILSAWAALLLIIFIGIRWLV